MPLRLCSKNSDQLPVLNRLTDIFAVDEFDYCVMVRNQNLTRKPELFRAPLGLGPGTMYLLNPPLAGPGCHSKIVIYGAGRLSPLATPLLYLFTYLIQLHSGFWISTSGIISG